jgi:hypothetical protein
MDDLELEYHLYLDGNPIQTLKDDASKLTLAQKRVIGPYIRRAESFIKISEPFRKLLRLDDGKDKLLDAIGVAWAHYFEHKINKKYMVIPKDVSLDFMEYFGSMAQKDKFPDDKYIKKAQRIILSHEKSIDAFIKAFHSIRLANDKYLTLKK